MVDFDNLLEIRSRLIPDPHGRANTVVDTKDNTSYRATPDEMKALGFKSLRPNVSPQARQAAKLDPTNPVNALVELAEEREQTVRSTIVPEGFKLVPIEKPVRTPRTPQRRAKPTRKPDVATVTQAQA